MDSKKKNDPDGSLMYVMCSKCREFLDPKPGNLNSVSHGLCQKCYEEEMKTMNSGKKIKLPPRPVPKMKQP